MSPIPSYTPEQLTQATADWSTCIGKGGYGDVFAGKLSGQEVAVKRMNNAAGTSPVGHAAFEREMLVSQVLTHDSVVPVIGFSQQGSSRCLVYPLHQGSLEDRLHRRGPAPVLRQAIRLRIAADLASTLQAMHAKGVVHGDVKAGNVLLTTELRGLFTDFGQAHVQPELCETSELQRPSERDTLARDAGAAGDSGAAATRPVETRNRCGTEGYRAPELEPGTAPTAASDIFSLGTLLLELLSGMQPMTGRGRPGLPETVHGRVL
ncbi:hypothetical protein CYMTET_49364, partial [Cymbomonas tetramitiformis]